MTRCHFVALFSLAVCLVPACKARQTPAASLQSVTFSSESYLYQVRMREVSPASQAQYGKGWGPGIELVEVDLNGSPGPSVDDLHVIVCPKTVKSGSECLDKRTNEYFLRDDDFDFRFALAAQALGSPATDQSLAEAKEMLYGLARQSGNTALRSSAELQAAFGTLANVIQAAIGMRGAVSEEPVEVAEGATCVRSRSLTKAEGYKTYGPGGRTSIRCVLPERDGWIRTCEADDYSGLRIWDGRPSLTIPAHGLSGEGRRFFRLESEEFKKKDLSLAEVEGLLLQRMSEHCVTHVIPETEVSFDQEGCRLKAVLDGESVTGLEARCASNRRLDCNFEWSSSAANKLTLRDQDLKRYEIRVDGSRPLAELQRVLSKRPASCREQERGR